MHSDPIKKIKADFDAFIGSLIDRKRNAYLIFTDISNSTLLSNTNERQYFNKCFNHILYSHELLKTDRRNIVKTIGDEVMLTEILTSDDDTSEISKEIIAATIEFQEYLAQYTQIDTKIAIHLCKDVVSGEALDDEASKRVETKDFSGHPGDIFGREVSLCARMMGIANKGQILISQDFFDSLGEEIKNSAHNNETLTISDHEVLIDVPMHYYFKGFEKKNTQGDIVDFNYQKVMQICYDLENRKKLLSVTGYNFSCLTFFNISGYDNPDNIERCINLIKDIFPRRSYPYIFKKKSGRTHPTNLLFEYHMGVLFQAQNYETYTMLFQKLQDKLGDLLVSSLTNPIWEGHENHFNELAGTKWLSLWKANNYKRTIQLHENSLDQDLSLIVLGYYDALTISDNYDLTDSLFNTFSRLSLLGAKDNRETFCVETIYDNRMYSWQ